MFSRIKLSRTNFQFLKSFRFKLSSYVCLDHSIFKTNAFNYLIIEPKTFNWKETKSLRFFHNTSKLLFSGEEFTTQAFHHQADTILNEIQASLEEIIEKNQIAEDTDITYSDGILTIKLGDKGTYVVNKQTPNKQIWLSSPISGPKRFNFDFKTGKWKNSRDSNEELTHYLASELSSILKFQITL